MKWNITEWIWRKPWLSTMYVLSCIEETWNSFPISIIVQHSDAVFSLNSVALQKGHFVLLWHCRGYSWTGARSPSAMVLTKLFREHHQKGCYICTCSPCLNFHEQWSIENNYLWLFKTWIWQSHPTMHSYWLLYCVRYVVWHHLQNNLVVLPDRFSANDWAHV